MVKESTLEYVVGAPGSGKTTYAIGRIKDGFHYVEIDALSVLSPTTHNPHARTFPIEVIPMIKRAKSFCVLAGVATNWQKLCYLADRVVFIAPDADEVMKRHMEREEKVIGRKGRIDLVTLVKWISDWTQGGKHYQWIVDHRTQFVDYIQVGEAKPSLSSASLAGEHELCDLCGLVTTFHVPPGTGVGRKKDKIPVLRHFHGEGANGTVCLRCSGRSLADWDAARKMHEKTDPIRVYPESLNAPWTTAWGEFPKRGPPPKPAATPVIESCQYFSHPYAKGTPGHVHICLHSSNPSQRCGYELTDWWTCPLVQADAVAQAMAKAHRKA